MVERLEARHHRLADAHRLHLIPERFHLALDPAHEPVDLGRIDVAFAAGVTDGSCELVAVERLTLAVLLDDRQVAQLDALEGGEARATGLALPPATDGGTILAGPAVLNLAVFVRAEGAAHALEKPHP